MFKDRHGQHCTCRAPKKFRGEAGYRYVRRAPAQRCHESPPLAGKSYARRASLQSCNGSPPQRPQVEPAVRDGPEATVERPRSRPSLPSRRRSAQISVFHGARTLVRTVVARTYERKHCSRMHPTTGFPCRQVARRFPALTRDLSFCQRPTSGAEADAVLLVVDEHVIDVREIERDGRRPRRPSRASRCCRAPHVGRSAARGRRGRSAPGRRGIRSDLLRLVIGHGQ